MTGGPESNRKRHGSDWPDVSYDGHEPIAKSSSGRCRTLRGSLRSPIHSNL